MRTIVNNTVRPLRVPLPGGKVLFLGPKKSGQVADGARLEHAALRKLLKAGDIRLEDGAEGGPDGGPGPSESGRESSHGHAKSDAVRRGGQRGA